MINKREKQTGKKVVVGLNGGIASCVTAFLLKKQGFDVIGCSVVMEEENNDQLEKIKLFAKSIHIPFYIVNGKSRFQDQVIDPLVSSRICGLKSPFHYKTHTMIIEILFDKMSQLGGDFLATGHFAKIRQGIQTDTFTIHSGVELKRDKSNLLTGLDSSLLLKYLLPLGDLHFEDVEKIAANFNLVETGKLTWTKNSLDSFEQRRKLIVEGVAKSLIKPGNVFNIENESSYGEHDGIAFYEIGQKELTFSNKEVRKEEKLEIVAFNIKEKKILIGKKENLTANGAFLVHLNLMSSITTESVLDCFFRFEGNEVLIKGSLCFKSAEGAVAIFDEDVYPLAFGDRVVFYDKNTRKAKVIGDAILSQRGSFARLDRAKDFRSSNEALDISNFIGF